MFRILSCGIMLCSFATKSYSQETFPVNGVADKRTKTFLFTHATIVKNSTERLTDASMLIRDGKIIAVGKNVAAAKDAVEINCEGKYIYPSFIDLSSQYGMPVVQRSTTQTNFFAPSQISTNGKGAYGWNDAIRSSVNAVELFNANNVMAKPMLENGFGAVLTHQADGIAQGTSVFVSLGEMPVNKAIIKEKAAAHYSFTKGSSRQSYPSSLMGSIALLRQTYLDAQWYKTSGYKEETNQSLQAWNNGMSLPQIFEAGSKWNDLRASRIADEMNTKYILIGGGDEYERLDDIKNTKSSFILNVNFPQAMEVEDPNDARFVTLATLKEWEMAPANAAKMAKAGIDFCFTSDDLKSAKDFLPNLRKAMYYGLTEAQVLDALTKTPVPV